MRRPSIARSRAFVARRDRWGLKWLGKRIEMSSSEPTMYHMVHCERHGDNREAFICEHLMRGDGSQFFSDVDDPSNPYPDAWCSRCESARDESGMFASDYFRETFKLVCGSCYEEIKAKHIVGPESSVKMQ